jgi:hypothetical protein
VLKSPLKPRRLSVNAKHANGVPSHDQQSIARPNGRTGGDYRAFADRQPCRASRRTNTTWAASGESDDYRAQESRACQAKADINPHDAVVLLTADHNEIDKLVREFECRRKTADHIEKGKRPLRVWHALAVPATFEKEIFYPAAEAVLEGDDKELLEKARIEHDLLRHLIAKIENMPSDHPKFDSTVMAEQAARHVKQEEEEIFPRLRHSRLDLIGTGERTEARKTSRLCRRILRTLEQL